MYRHCNPTSKNINIFKINGSKIAKGFSALMLVFLFLGGPALATDNQTLEQQKREAQSKLNDTTAQKQTLASQIGSFDRQISNIQAEINSTQAEIDRLSIKITQTNNDISKAKEDIAAKKILLAEYVKTMYINGQTSQLELVLTSNNFSDFVDQSEYLQVIRSSVTDTVKMIEEAKVKLEADKKSLQEAEAKALVMKEEQISRQGAIQSQRSLQDSLLQKTKGDEQAYQSLIKNLQKEINDNNARTWGGNFVSQGHVNKGDIIGYIGNTGYSTGPHLHFEIRDEGRNTVNPSSYIGNGYFIDPAPSVPINVPYGYSDAYFYGWFHSGIDKADGGAGTPIRAVADGDIVVRETGWGNTYYSTGQVVYGNYVLIQHTNGMFSLYGHMR